MKTPNTDTSAPAAVDPSAPHWSTEVCDVSARDKHATDERARQQIADRTALCQAVTVGGALFFQRVHADFHTTAAVANRAAGCHVFDVHRTPVGAISLTGRSHGYVMVVPNLGTDEGDTPGATVTMTGGQIFGGRTVDPYLFELNGALRMRCRGELAGPERFAQLVAADWIARTLSQSLNHR
jgi:hypothetical protein